LRDHPYLPGCWALAEFEPPTGALQRISSAMLVRDSR
jgi:hypothetical protein